MKFNNNTLFGALLSLLFCACANRENNKPVMLHWYITEGITLTDSIRIIDLFGDTVVTTAFSDGRVNMDDIEEGYYEFKYSDENYNYLSYTFYLIPGQNLSIHIDASQVSKERPLSVDKDNVEFSGDLSTISEYLVEVDDIWIRDFGARKSKNINAALKTSSQAREKHELLLSKLPTENIGMFKERELRSIPYRYYYQINHKKANYQAFEDHQKEPMGTIPAFADNGFPESTEEYNIVNGEGYKILGYKDLADIIVENKCKYLSGVQSESKGVYAMKLLSKFSDGKLKDYLTKKYYRLYRTPIIPDREEMDEIYKLALSNITTPEYKESLKEIYEDAKMMAPGVQAPSFELLNHNDKMVSLEDFRGSYVYMDIWAVFCAPCKREIPYLKELEEDYKDANIKFVSVTLDDLKRKGKWVKFVKDKKLGGIQLMADNKFRADVKNLYQNMSIPRFALIDPTGKFVSAKAAAPSSPHIRVLFDKLLTM